MKKLWAPCLGMLVFASASLHAQETTRFAFDLGGGFTSPLGIQGTRTDYGWGLKAGAGINVNSHLGLMLNVGYDSLGINSGTLSQIGVTGGNLNIFSARFDPVLHVGTYRHADFYITGGGGLYHQERTFGSPVSGATEIVDPFLSYAPVTGAVGAVASSYSVNKPGIDAGMGVAFGSKWHGKFFAEARYNRIFNNDTHTDYLPVTFGFRW